MTHPKIKFGASHVMFCLTFKTQAYDFFIGRLELQYPHEAD